jgi:hypothetical protein
MEDLEAFGVSRHLFKKWTVGLRLFPIGGKGSFFPPFALFLTPSIWIKSPTQFPAIWIGGFLKENPFGFFWRILYLLDERNVFVPEVIVAAFYFFFVLPRRC